MKNMNRQPWITPSTKEVHALGSRMAELVLSSSPGGRDAIASGMDRHSYSRLAEPQYMASGNYFEAGALPYGNHVQGHRFDGNSFF